MIFNGIDLTEYLSINEITGRGLVATELSTVSVPGRDGERFVGKRTPARVIGVKVTIKAADAPGVRAAIDEVNAILNVSEPVPITFEDEPNVTYYGMPESTSESRDFLRFHQGEFKIVCFDPYKYGPEITETWPMVETIQTDFMGKVSGSVVENPHLAKREGSQTSLQSPTGSWAEFGNGTGSGVPTYENISSLNGVIGSQAGSVNGAIAQHLFSFNLIEYVQRKYGVTVPGATTAGKVQWLKDNANRITCRWHGFGSGPSGNKASLAGWYSNSSWATAGTTNTTGSVGLIPFAITSVNMSSYISSDGFIHFLAYAEASDGTTASTINTDYVELEVELKKRHLPLTLTYDGAVATRPIIDMTVKASTTLALAQNQNDEYMLLGWPVDADSTPKERLTSVLQEGGASLVGWSAMTAGHVITDGSFSGIVGGSMMSTGYSFKADTFGTNANGWVGPAIRRSLGQSLQDFKVVADIESLNAAGGCGKIGIFMLDASSNIVASMGVSDPTATMANNTVHFRLGGSKAIYSEQGARYKVYNNSRLYVSLEREGEVITVRAYEVLPDGRMTSRSSYTYNDRANNFQAPVTQVMLYIAKAKSYATFPMSIHGVSVLKVNSLAGTEIPYIVQPGDTITFDHQAEVPRINGEPRKDLKDFGAQYFDIQPGANQISFYPEDALDATVKYREKIK